MIRLVLGDDHTVVRQGLRALLSSEPELAVVGDAGDGEGVLRLVAERDPDVLVLDWVMPGVSGLDVTRLVRSRHPRTRVLILSMHRDEAYVIEAMRSGASGYVLKDASAAELVAAVRAVAGGALHLGGSWTAESLERYARQAAGDARDPYESLTAREREILVLAAEGYTSPQIGLKLLISHRTVETHRFHIMRKLGLYSQTDLVRYAMKRGLLRDDGS